MAKEENQKAARVFADAFAASLAESLTRTARHPWQLKVLEVSDTAAQQGEAIHLRATTEGSLRGSVFIEVYELQLKELASKIGGATVSAFDEGHADAFEKVIVSAMGGLAVVLSAEYGSFTCKVERASGPALGGMMRVPLAASEADEPEISIGLYFDGQLLSALASVPAAQNAAETHKSPLDPLNLDLVMDVELNVSLRFGQRQLPLREVLELSSGSVIELDRQVDDPVELLLDGKVIARGEAVIVDGNYGLRVTEIPQPMASHFGR
jgi:flagellar motor switch protein FliN/FliY